MKFHEQFSRELKLDGEWHIHTTYTDGKNTVDEYCRVNKEELNFPVMAFTEHVRKNLNYDFYRFITEVEEARQKYDFTIVKGIETKILPGGELDVDQSILDSVDYVIIAFHKFPEDKELYLDSLSIALTHPKVSTWAHPGHFLERKGMQLDRKELEHILKLVKQHNVLVEINPFYHTPLPTWIEGIKSHKIPHVWGGNIHSLEDFRKYPKELRLKYLTNLERK